MEQLKEKLKQISKQQKIIMICVIVIVIIAIASILGVFVFADKGITGSSKKATEPTTLEEQIRKQVNTNVSLRAMLTYEGTPTVSITRVKISTDETTAEVYGKVSIKDNYGDTYTGNFDADVTIKDGTISVKNIDIETPTRSRLGN